MHTYTKDQYIFIHDAILESVTCGDTRINASELRTALHTLKNRTHSRQTGFENQFGVSCVPMQYSQTCGVHVHNVEHCPVLCQILEKVSPNPAEAKAVAAQSNHQKNRSMEFLPGASTTVFSMHYHMTLYTVPSGQVACGSERREPRLHLCLHCACKLSLGL